MYTNNGLEYESDPIAVIEDIAKKNKWPSERYDEQKLIAITVRGFHREYHMTDRWIDDIGILKICAFYDYSVSRKMKPKLLRLINELNGSIAFGHFTYQYDEDGHYLFFICELPLVAEMGGAEEAQIDFMHAKAIEAMDHFYPAFANCAIPDLPYEDAIETSMHPSTFGRA